MSDDDGLHFHGGVTAFATGSDADTDADDAGIDGRHARRDRNRELVIDAAVAFIKDGELQPTAHMLAERSGVSLRSVFRYFEDLGTLQAAAVDRVIEAKIHEYHFDVAAGSEQLEDRVDRWIRFRLDMAAASTAMFLVMAQHARHNEAVGDAVERVRARAIELLRALFAPEIDPLPADEQRLVLAALHSAQLAETSVNLAGRHGLDQAEQHVVLRRLMLGALQAR